MYSIYIRKVQKIEGEMHTYVQRRVKTTSEADGVCVRVSKAKHERQEG